MHSQQSSTSDTRIFARPRSRQARARHGEGSFSYLPAANAEQEAQHIGLLLLLKFLNVLKRTHLFGEVVSLDVRKFRPTDAILTKS